MDLGGARKGGRPMYTSITVRDILRRKGQGYWATTPETTAYEALELMAEKDIGALLVMDGNKLAGIFSERDYARKVILKGRSSKTTLVQELMTSPAITAGTALNLHECMVLMTENHIRHLPVIEGSMIIGVLSIGDVVAAVIAAQEETIHQLEDYISGEDYAVRTVR
jgi:signal-transduction protein with cAMP-binding, CBS, and nucleotidyltransferase domain